MNSGLYVIHNKVDGSRYIGSSISLRRRLRDHRSSLRRGTHGNIHLQRAWNRDGESSFEFSVLAYLESRQCLYTEQHYLNLLRGYGVLLYNLAIDVTSPMKGRRWSRRMRVILKRSRSQQWKDPQKVASMTAALKAARADPKLRARHAAKMREYWVSPKGLARKANMLPLSEEHRRKLSEAGKGHVKSQETCDRLSKALTGRTFSAEHLNNISKAQRKRRKREAEVSYSASL
jgi:group I intron endonuclease